MRSYTVEEIGVKEFMQHLFVLDTFVEFEMRGVTIHSFTHFEISGEGDDGFCTWEEIRPYVRHIIKGRDKPRAMKIIFARASPETLHPNAAALFINIAYDGEKINITTAGSQKNFELSKSMDIEWDNWVADFLAEKGMASLRLE